MEPTARKHCAVTGANGYVGSRICDYFAARGWTLFELTRRPTSRTLNRVHVPFELGSKIDPAVFRDNGIRVLIHCAYDFRPVKWSGIYRVNVEGSVDLLRSAKAAGIDTIIFISSISAFKNCESLYGKAKLEIERVASEVGALIIRPGLVFGERGSGGMFGSLQKTVSNSRIVPLIGSGQYLQYLVHEDDLCELLFKVSSAQLSLPEQPIVLAAPHGWPMRDLLQVLAAERKTSLRFVPLPWRLVWLVLKLSEFLGARLPFRSDSIISLVRQGRNPDFSGTQKIGYRLREFNDKHVAAYTAM